METELVKILVLSSALAHYVLAIVLGGILIAEYFKRKKKLRGGILGYVAFSVTILIFYILDIYRNFVAPSVLLNWIGLFLDLLASIFFVATSLKYLKNINKILFISVTPFALGIATVEVLRLLQIGANLEIYTAITTLAATILGYFMIVDFLINTSERRNEKV